MKTFTIAILDDDGNVMVEQAVTALGPTAALASVAFGPDSRAKALINQGLHEVSIMTMEAAEGARLEQEAAPDSWSQEEEAA